ncbi:MAG: DUF1549 domain-containing protein, partial [Chthonomonadales bacterium]
MVVYNSTFARLTIASADKEFRPNPAAMNRKPIQLTLAVGSIAFLALSVFANNPPQKGTSSFWSFQPVKVMTPPVIKIRGQAIGSVDAFLQVDLQKKGLTLNPIADKRTLIRRATYDLTGLPPTAKEVDAFISDNSPDAFSKLVDRLLASPAYGQRWG